MSARINCGRHIDCSTLLNLWQRKLFHRTHEPMRVLVRGMSYSLSVTERRWARPSSSDTVTMFEMYYRCCTCYERVHDDAKFISDALDGWMVQGWLLNAPPLYLWLDLAELTWQVVKQRTRLYNSRSWIVLALPPRLGVVELCDRLPHCANN